MYELECAVCREMVRLTRRRYMDLIDRDEKPVCRRNGCEQLVGAKSLGTVRVSQAVYQTHVAGSLYVIGQGQRRHNLAPLANGRIKRVRIDG